MSLVASVADPASAQSRTGPSTVFFLAWDAAQAQTDAATAFLGGGELSFGVREAGPAVDLHAWLDALGTASALLASLTAADVLRSEGFYWVRRRGVGIGVRARAPVLERGPWTAALRVGASAGGVWFPAYLTGDAVFVKRARGNAGVFVESASGGWEVGLDLIRAVVDGADYREVVDSRDNEAFMAGARASLELTPRWWLTAEFVEGAPGASQVILGLEWSGT